MLLNGIGGPGRPRSRGPRPVSLGLSILVHGCVLALAAGPRPDITIPKPKSAYEQLIAGPGTQTGLVPLQGETAGGPADERQGGPAADAGGDKDSESADRVVAEECGESAADDLAEGAGDQYGRQVRFGQPGGGEPAAGGSAQTIRASDSAAAQALHAADRDGAGAGRAGGRQQGAGDREAGTQRGGSSVSGFQGSDRVGAQAGDGEDPDNRCASGGDRGMGRRNRWRLPGSARDAGCGSSLPGFQSAGRRGRKPDLRR